MQRRPEHVGEWMHVRVESAGDGLCYCVTGLVKNKKCIIVMICLSLCSAFTSSPRLLVHVVLR